MTLVSSLCPQPVKFQKFTIKGLAFDQGQIILIRLYLIKGSDYIEFKNLNLYTQGKG